MKDPLPRRDGCPQFTQCKLLFGIIPESAEIESVREIVGGRGVDPALGNKKTVLIQVENQAQRVTRVVDAEVLNNRPDDLMGLKAIGGGNCNLLLKGGADCI